MDDSIKAGQFQNLHSQQQYVKQSYKIINKNLINNFSIINDMKKKFFQNFIKTFSLNYVRFENRTVDSLK